MFEKVSNRLDVHYVKIIELSGIIKVSSHLLQVCDCLIDNLNELSGRSAVALRHDERIADALGFAERCKGNRILVRLGGKQKQG